MFQRLVSNTQIMEVTLENLDPSHGDAPSLRFPLSPNTPCPSIPPPLSCSEDPNLCSMAEDDQDLDMDISEFESIMHEDTDTLLNRVQLDSLEFWINMQELQSGESSTLSINSEPPPVSQSDIASVKVDSDVECQWLDESGYSTLDAQQKPQDLKHPNHMVMSTNCMRQPSDRKVLVDLTDTDSEAEEDLTIDRPKRKLPDWAVVEEKQKKECSSNVFPNFQCMEQKLNGQQTTMHVPNAFFPNFHSSALPTFNFAFREHSTASNHLTAGAGLRKPDNLLVGRQGISLFHEGFPEAYSLNKGLQRSFPSTLEPSLNTAKGTVPKFDELASFSIPKGIDDNIDEAFPDEGLLTVPLLKHQKMAVAWMEQKERGAMCPGGILADDQGLGKTVSTIALILKAKASGLKSMLGSSNQIEAETTTVNLDDEDDGQHGIKKPLHIDFVEKSLYISNEQSEKKFSVSRGRPSAGTLVVCPTSILKQWSQELKEKVAEAAELSVLIYHGGNRTKDPMELAKHDVVLTTYAIVSMEVPKQPLLGEKESDQRIPGNYGLDALSCSSNSKKRETLVESRKLKRSKGNSGDIEALDHPDSGPLAKVAWFRVILDEAQNIKNRKTQVARACWSLRAKRRWCLSGTPIQNAVDDLYSYFRFLKYDPFSLYKEFCREIKEPIVRNPRQGYKNLQSILLKVMLRRTKETTFNGEPILNLPQKNVTMKQIDFSHEERSFYTNLESQCRQQFQVYAAAGTVKHNYVNILWMLLRLRQACDHPLLVKDHHDDDGQRNALETASRIPAEKRSLLLAVLERNNAMCIVCMDAPEEPVVSICAHVFCRQCISQHLNLDDDACCPVPKCHTILNSSLIFSASALMYASYGINAHGQNGIAMECHRSSKENVPKCSSKIKAVIETLQALPPLQPSSRMNDKIPADLLRAEPIRDNKNKILTEKAIVFSQWTSMLDLLEASLKEEGFCYRRLDGTMSVQARDRALADFKLLPEVTVMIMSLKAASLGLNLVVACHVLLLDIWWNPTTEDQAIDRAHRIGQTRNVTVSRFTVKNTIEDRILALQDRKRQIVASAFGEDMAGEQRTRLTVDDMHYLFRI